MAGLHMGCVVEYGGFEVVPGAVVVVGEVVGVTQGVSGTCHCPADSEQLSTWPLGERQSLVWELSQVPGKGYIAGRTHSILNHQELQKLAIPTSPASNNTA